MSADDVILRVGGYEVRGNTLVTPKATHDLGSLSAISVRRQFAYGVALPVAGVALTVAILHRYFYAHELLVIGLVTAATVVFALRYGVLTVNSMAIANNPSLASSFGTMKELRAIERAVRDQMAARGRKGSM